MSLLYTSYEAGLRMRARVCVGFAGDDAGWAWGRCVVPGRKTGSEEEGEEAWVLVPNAEDRWLVGGRPYRGRWIWRQTCGKGLLDTSRKWKNIAIGENRERGS